MTQSRADLLALLTRLGEAAPELRIGQLVANLATLALGAKAEATWDVEDEELLAAAKRLLSHYEQRNASVPA